MNIFNEDILINGHTLLRHQTEHIFIVIENDIDIQQLNHIYKFDPEGMIEHFLRNNMYLEEYYHQLLSEGYVRYEATEFPVWFPIKYKTIYKLQIGFPGEYKRPN